MIHEAQNLPAGEEVRADGRLQTRADGRISIAGWAYSLGSRIMSAEQIERDLGLPLHKIRDGAGIHSVCLTVETEDELALAQRASEIALEMADVSIENIDLLVATSTTFLA
jgi:3-oxoacyl-[acyl-carrier-protein] synthase III